MIISNDGSKIDQQSYANEDELQSLIYKNPEVLSEEGSELISIAREISTKQAGRIDVLAITSGGIITIVEVKLGRNAESRREVLAQIFDYISDLSTYSYYELDQATGGNLSKVVDDFENNAELPRIIEDNLKNGLVRLIIAVDESNDDLRRLVEFVAKYTKLRVDLIEIKKYHNGDGYLYNSNFVVQSSFSVFGDRVSAEKSYPLLDKIVALWGQSGRLPKIRNSNRSFRQIRIKNWPSAVHYEFTILHNKPVVNVRLDNELYASDVRNDIISKAIESFAGQKICGYELQIRPYSRSGSGRVLFVPVPAEDVEHAPEIMAELIHLTKDAIDQALAN